MEGEEWSGMGGGEEWRGSSGGGWVEGEEWSGRSRRRWVEWEDGGRGMEGEEWRGRGGVGGWRKRSGGRRVERELTAQDKVAHNEVFNKVLHHKVHACICTVCAHEHINTCTI